MTAKFFNFNLVATLVLCSSAVNSESFPNTISKCHYGDVDCIKNVANKMVQSSPGGIPELGLGSIDPLYIGKTTMEQGAPTSPVNMKIRMKNATMVGIGQFRMNKIVGFGKNPETTKFEIYGYCPQVTVSGSYQMSGKALVVPVQGHGAANITFYDNDISLKLITHTENRNGADHLVVDNILYDNDPKRMAFNFDNLFNDPVISESMNKFFNENQDILLTELKPTMSAMFGKIVKKKLDPIFKRFAYKEFFLE